MLRGEALEACHSVLEWGNRQETMENQLNLFSRKKINKTAKRNHALNHFAQITKKKIPDVRGKVRNQGYLISEKLKSNHRMLPLPHKQRQLYKKSCITWGEMSRYTEEIKHTEQVGRVVGQARKGASPIHSRNDLEWLRRLTVARCDIGSISLAFKLTSNLVEDNGGFARHDLDLRED